MNDILIRIAEIEADRGLAILISIIFLCLVLTALAIFYRNWSEQKVWERRRADRKDELEEKQVKEAQDTNRYLASVLATNGIKMQSLEEIILSHQEKSTDSLKDLDAKLDKIDDKVKMIGRTQDKLATKEMVEEVSENIQDIRSIIKKD